MAWHSAFRMFVQFLQVPAAFPLNCTEPGEGGWGNQCPGAALFQGMAFLVKRRNKKCSLPPLGGGSGGGGGTFRFSQGRHFPMRGAGVTWAVTASRHLLAGISVDPFYLRAVSSEIFDLLLFVSYFASQSKGIKFGNYYFDVCCVN